MVRARTQSLGLRSASSGSGLVLQVLGLIVLYWLLRSADVTSTVLGGLTSGVRWLQAPVGIGAVSDGG